MGNIKMFRALPIVCVNILLIVTDVTRVQTRSLSDGMTIHKTVLTWEEAYETCQKSGAVLASPINDNALNAIKTWMGVKNTLYFIGIRSWYPGIFVSVEGVRIENITISAIDMIDTVDQRNGDCLAMNSDSIRAVPCWSMLPYMCYNTNIFNTNVTISALNMNKTNCGRGEEGYQYYESEKKCYKTQTEKSSWVQAEQRCIAEGGHLVVIDNDNEARIVRDMISSHPDWDWVMVGLYDRTNNGDWTSVHGQRVEDLYNVWYTGYKIVHSAFPCAVFNKSMVYATNTCDYKYYFICERAPTV